MIIRTPSCKSLVTPPGYFDTDVNYSYANVSHRDAAAGFPLDFKNEILRLFPIIPENTGSDTTTVVGFIAIMLYTYTLYTQHIDASSFDLKITQ